MIQPTNGETYTRTVPESHIFFSLSEPRSIASIGEFSYQDTYPIELYHSTPVPNLALSWSITFEVPTSHLLEGFGDTSETPILPRNQCFSLRVRISCNTASDSKLCIWPRAVSLLQLTWLR